MFFTQDDYKKIQQWLTKNSVKDTEFNEANIPFNGEETITIVQGNQNKKVFLKDLIAQVFNLGISDFVNITDKYNAPNISLEEAIRLIPSRARKEGQVITFLDMEDHWHIYQFKGALNQWNVLDTWEDLFDWEKLIIDSILPDEEDLTKSEPDANGNSYLSLKDRAYNPEDFSGLGRVILRKNIMEVEDPIYGKVKKNILYQDMFTQSNTIYEIRYDFDLSNQTITIPENCTLKYEGGSLNDGHIVYQNTKIQGIETLNNVTTEGLFVNINAVSDEEDLHTNNGVLKFADREYNPNAFSGLGKIILRKNIVNGKNILTQDMINKENTIYEIRYNFDLNGSEITIPEGCTLCFEGGKFINGTINGTNTQIIATLTTIFENVELIGSWKMTTWYPEWFNSDGTKENDQKAIDSCIKVLDITRGGILHLTNTYNADILIDRTNASPNISYSLIIEGEGFNKTFLNGEDTERIVLKANSSNVIQFTVRDICIQGPGGATPKGLGIHIPNYAASCSFERIHFNGLDTCIKLADTFLCTFQTLKFRNYIVGITGTKGYSANNNIFSNVNFGDGTKNGTDQYVTCPIISTGMGYNCYIACDFEASYTIKTVDMRGGSGYDNFIKCRFERLNKGAAPWIQLGDNQNIDRCEFWPSSDHSEENYLIEVYGKGNSINPLSVESSTNGSKTLHLMNGSQNTRVNVVFPNPDPFDKFIANVVTDEGINNVITHVNCVTTERIITDGSKPIIQWITDNINLTTANHTSNIAFYKYAVGSLTLQKNSGIKSYGDSFIMDRKDSNSGKLWWTADCSTNYKYIFSIYIYCESETNVRIFAEQGSSLISAYDYHINANMWQRIYITINYGSRNFGPVNFGIENIETDSLFIQYPQLEEYSQNLNIVMPQQLVLNPNESYCIGFEEGYDKAPTAGKHYAGEFIRNIGLKNNPKVFGWVCIEGGTPGVWETVNIYTEV